MFFEPRAAKDTLYGVNSKEFTEATAMAAETVHTVTYDTMHHRFAHVTGSDPSHPNAPDL
jgi:hypothetical protein